MEHLTAIAVIVIIVFIWLYMRRESATMPPSPPPSTVPTVVPARPHSAAPTVVPARPHSGTPAVVSTVFAVPPQAAAVPAPARPTMVVAQNTRAVRLFDRRNFAGTSRPIGRGRYVLNDLGLQNRLSSIAVPRGMRVDIYKQDDCQGVPLTITDSVARLDDYDMNNEARCLVVSNI